ncbi:MAG: GAF domain-containing protein [Chloroflexi bacterium]|nr:MAG: GAF domain-containing protein [Chloroflexota bacterium]
MEMGITAVLRVTTMRNFGNIQYLNKPTEELAQALTAERERLLSLSLKAVAYLGSPSLLAVLGLQLIQNGRLDITPVLIAVIVIILLFWGALIFPKSPYQLRAVLVPGSVFVLAIIDLHTGGYVGNGRLALLSFSIATFILLGIRAGLLTILLNTAVLIYYGTIISSGALTPINQEVFVTGRDWITIVIRAANMFGIVGFATYTLIRSAENALQRQRALTEILKQEREILEARIADRTKTLQIAVDLGTTLTTILDQNQLILEVVELVKATFNYYHVHIYLLDETGQNLVMKGGTGEAGRAMLVGGHKIAVGKGLVGKAAQTRKPVLVPDVSQSSEWLPNPLLPETKSELAVPVIAGDELLGVLDIQNNLVNSLDEEDAEVIEAVANQIGIALKNAQLYQKVQQQVEYETAVNRIGQKIQLAPDPNLVLQVTTRELGQALKTNRVEVRLKTAVLAPKTAKPEDNNQ